MTRPLSDTSSMSHFRNPDRCRQRGGYPVSRCGRWALALWSLCLLGGFAVAYDLQPDPRGFGTHEQLGLPACTFRRAFDIPCPSCGMTTCFSYFVRGHLMQAARANVAGLLLAVVCALQIPWCGLSLYRGRLWRVNRPEAALIWLLASLCALGGLQWAIRLIFS